MNIIPWSEILGAPYNTQRPSWQSRTQQIPPVLFSGEVMEEPSDDKAACLPSCAESR
jgi:hypothetical protein